MATEYDKKIAELQVYLPALERRISDARNRKDNVVTGRLEKLRDIVVKKIKVPMEILHKMEEAIRKFIKDVSSSTTSASDLSKNQSSGSKGDLSSKIEVTPVEVKKEPNLHTTIATTDDDDDDDDVKFVESSTSESIIILDDDSSDEEPTKQPNIEIQATQFNLATVKTEVEESCSTLSKEIAKVKDSDEIVERVSSNKKSITLPTAGTSESAAGYNASLNGLEVPQEEELNLKEPCDSNPTRDNNSGPDIVAKVQFDASKVAESRGILQEIESQLKELTTTAQLPLSLDDIDKNDSINEFLSKSSDMSCNKSFKLLENEISPLTTAKQIEVSEANSENNSVLQKLPFPFPSFGNPMLSFVTESPNEAAEKDVASEYVNEAREEIAQSNSGKQISNSFVIPSTKSGTYSEILLPEVINENKVAHEAVPLPMKIDSSALPAIESTTSDVSAIDDDPTNRTTNRLSLPIQIVSSALSTKESTAKDLSAIDGDSTNRTSNQLSLAMQVETSVSSTKESMVEDVSVIDDYPSNRINNRLSLAMVVESSALTAKESTAKDLSAIDGDSKNRTSNQLSLAMQVETSVSSTKKFMVEDVSAIDDDPTSRTSNRLSDIIASLRRNLKHIDSTAPDYSASKEKAKAKEKENKSKLLDVVANKNNLSDLPIVVEDMLASEVASDEETNSLVIEDSSFAMGSNLIDDLGICSINSLETVSDLPNNVMEGDDSLDREINQALAGTSVNQSANDMEGDSFEIAQAAEFHANEINTLKHNDASKVDSNLALELDASNSEKKDESIEVSHSSPVLEIEEQLVHSFNNTPCNHKTSDESMQVDLDSSLSYFATSSLIDNNQASLIIHVTASDDEASEYATTNAQNSNLAEKIAGIVQKEIPIKENDQHETEVFTLETGCLSSSRIESSDIEPTQTKSDSIQPFDKVSGELNVETEESQGTIIFEITTNGYENNQQVFETPDIQKSRPCMIDHPIEISDKSEIVPDSSTISIVDKTTTSPSDEQEASLVLENAQHIRIYVDKHDETRDSDKKIAEPVKSFSSSKAEAAENVTNLDGLKTEQSADKCKPVKRPSSSKAEAAENVTNLEELQTEQSADKCEPVKSPSSSKAETAENATNLDELQSGQSTDKCEPVKSPSSSKAETAKNATNLDELQSGQSTDKCDTVAESITKIQMDAIAANEAKEASEELFLAKLRSTVSIRPITPIHDQEQSSEKSNLKKDKDLECRLRGSKIIASFGKPKTSAGSLNTFKIMQKELSKSDPIDKTESVDLKLSCKKEISSNEEKSHPPTKSPIETEKKEELQEQIVPSTSAKNVKQPQASQESKDINSAIAGNSAKSNLASTPTQPKTLTVKKSSMSIECIETNQKINENISKDTGSTPTTEPEKEKPSERVVAAFSANPGFQDLVKRKRELERKLEELKKQLEQPELVAEAPMTTINAPNLEKALPIDQNLSEISESDKDCVSLSLSEISEPEPGEIIDKRAMPKPYEMPETIKREYPPLDYPKLIPHHMTFISDPSRLENENIKVTIKNEYNPGEDLRAKLIAKAKNEAYMQDQDNIDIRHKKRKKKHKKKKRRVHQEEVSVHHSPVRYVDCQGNIKYCREDLSSDSISDDDLAELMLRRRVLSQHLLDSDSYPQPELDYAQREYDALIQSYKRKTEKLIKAEYMEDNKYELQRDLDRRYGCSFSASDRILPRRVSASPPVLFPLKKRDSLSPLGRRSISPRRFSKSPVKLKRSPRRHSISPMRRRSISPNPFSKSPKRLSRSPLKRRSISPRRLSRSPLRVTRSPNRRSRSPRRLSRSPRRLSRSPRRRPIGISRRLSRSPRRNSRSPRRTRRSPIRPIRSPRRLSRSPKRLGRSPRRTSRSPRRTLRSPRRTLRSPRRSSRSPRRRVSRSPRRTSRPLRRLSRSPRALSPKKERRSPKRVSKSPYRSSKSPKKSTQLATQPLKSLKIENQGTSEAQPPKKPIESATESLDSLKIESQVTSEAQPPKESTQSETLPLHLLKTESQIASEAQPSVSNTPAASENSIDQQQTEVNYPTVIALTDSEDEASANATSGDTEKDSICFTIEVSDEDELVEAPPPPIISADVKKSPKHDEEELISIQKQKADNRQAYENVILIDDDEMNVKNYRESSDVTPFHPKIETTSKSDGSDDGHTMGAMLDDEDLYAPEDDPTTENVETLKEKNLMELQAIKIKLEREMGLSEDILSQLIGSAVDKFNGQPSDTQHYDSMGEDSQYPAMVKLPYQFYDPGNYSRAHVSHKDPRLNRIQPGTVEQVVVKPQLDEAPPPPLIPRLTPAVALPSGSPTSKSSGYKDDYSDDDCLSTGSGSGSEDSNQSGGSKKKKQFVMVEISKLEEIIGQQIAKFLAANKQEEESKKKSPSIAKKTKKDATVLTTASAATETTPPKKTRKNALSKDGSGPRHMTAEKIVSDIRKSMVASLSKSKNPAPEKVERPKSRTRIVKRFETSSESETEKKISPPTKKLSIIKKTTEEPETLRNRITHDLTGIIKLGQTPKSTKGKPAPALKLAEQITDVNLLTPLREIPYEDKRKKKPEAGQSKKQKRAPKNIDISMHCNSGESNCLLCKEMGKEEDLISHYVNVHRENEVYIARLEPHQVAALKQRPNRVKASRKSNIEKFTGKCPFCHEEMTCPIGRFMEHFASHTGEYAYECDCCGTRDSRKRDLLQHCNTECDKGAKFIYVYRYDLSNKTILGYICTECNYTQLNSANVIKHIRTEHEQQHVKSADLITVTLFDVSFGDTSADSGVEEEAVDNIEVNNEAIAEEEEDDYDVYDNFDYMPSPPPPPRAASMPTSGGDEFECVKNEMLTDVIDAIENIDWKPLEETLDDRDELELTKNNGETIVQQPTIFMNDSVHILPKGELDQSYCEQPDIGTQIFTEIHAMASQSLPSITTKEEPANNERAGVHESGGSKGNEDKDTTTPVAKTQPCKDEYLRAILEGTAPTKAVAAPAVSRVESVTSKPVKLKEHNVTITNLARVQSIGIEKVNSTQVKLHCFVQDCDFNPTDSLEELRKHIKAHKHKWSGKCIACGKGNAKKYLSIDRELLHLVNEHLPKKSMAPKLLRPWIANDKSDCYKTKEVCDMLTNQFHLENLYKCMGPDCVFTTNSSTDMQFHITLAHIDDQSALSCCYCNDRFIHANGLVDHIGKVHGASIYQCSKCFYRSVAAYNVQMHQRTYHADNKLLRILQCPGQSHNFSTEILEILDNRQRNVKPLSCPSCHKMVFVKHLLIDHIAKEHPKRDLGDINSALYDCIYCNFGTTDLLSIRQHMANEHPDQLLYVCGMVFIKAQHPLAQQTVDSSSIKTTSLVYIGDSVSDNIFISKDRTNNIISKNSIEWVNNGKDPTDLNEKIRQTFGECVINFSHVETYMRKIDEGMKPDAVKTEETSELEQLVSAAIGDTGFAGKELYRCGYPKCEDACDTFEQFDRHINSHKSNNKEQMYRCPHCCRVIAANQIRMHILQHRRHRYLCFFCGESSSAQNAAIAHLKEAHQSSSVVFVYLTSDKRDWGSHGQVNEQESRIFVAMPRKNNEDATEHMLEVLRKRSGQHSSTDILEPAVVERPLSPIELKEETLVPVFVAPVSRLCCNIDSCPFVAKADEELLQHISDRHLIIMSGLYSCAHCSYTLGSAQMKITRIGNHLQYHGPTIVVCNVCNYYHYNRYRVLNHISICHPYNFVTLTLHSRTPQGSKTKIEILYNKSVRSPEDSYKCTLCEAILTEYEDLFVHMKELHQLNVLFKCDACAFFDSTLQVVEAHAEKVHSNETKRRIRSVFVPVGNKWVQNLSPFELLFEYSISEEEKTLANCVTPTLPVPSVAEKVPPPKSVDTVATEGKKRKLEETESPKPMPETKKSRNSCLKRRTSPSSTEENVKRLKISPSPERAPEDKNTERSSRKERNQSDSACNKLTASDFNASVKLEVDTSKSAKKAGSEMKLAESSINAPEETHLSSNPSEKLNSSENATTPGQKTLPRLKVKPMSKLMPQNVTEPLSVLSPKRAELSTIFSPPTESPALTVANSKPPKRRLTEVYIICFQCGLKGDCFIKLSNHCRTQHPGEAVHFRVAKKLLCAFCYTIASFPEMKAHHFIDHAKDAFITRETANHKKCAECAFEYTEIKELKDHCGMAHSGLHLQMHSSYEFLNQEYLEELLKIGDDVIAKVCRCPHCDHIYLQESHCKNHMTRAHTSLAPDALPNRVPFKRLLYGCNQCNVFFETETRAIQHIRKHIDPYGCNYCEISFPTHSALEDHYRLCHKSSEQSYKFKNISENFKRFMEMLLRFSNGLVLTKYEAEYTDYGRHDEFLQRIENMEKVELRHWISKQTRTQAIDTIARIKIEIEREADMFLPVNSE